MFHPPFCNQREVREGGWWNFPTGYDGSREYQSSRRTVYRRREKPGGGGTRAWVAGRKARDHSGGRAYGAEAVLPALSPEPRTAVVNGAQLLKILFTRAWFGVERCALERALAYFQARENAGE